MELFKSQVSFDKYTCEDENGHITKYDYMETSLYIVFGYACNADCSFCVYHDNSSKRANEVDIIKLEKMLIDINKNGILISTVHLTGGEPTLNLENFKEVVSLVRRCLGNLVDISVNTNGIHLKELGQLVDNKLLNNIALSRHSLTFEDNREIFKTTTVPTDNDIRQFIIEHGQVIHLSCNLIKGYIDTAEKVVQYIEKAGELGVNDIGIVSLMDKNDYCKERYVEYKEIAKDLERLGLVRTRQHVKRDDPCKTDKNGKKCGNIICACENYLYTTKEFKMVQMYHRYAIKSDSIGSYLVYVNDEIRQGFNGKTIKGY